MYLDDTGTASLKTPNPHRQITCLCGVIIEDSVYRDQVVPRLSQFCGRWFGGHGPVIHRKEIQSASRQFHSFRKRPKAQRFHAEWNGLLASLEFRIVAVVVDVPLLREWQSLGYVFPDLPSNDYVRVVAFALERFARFLLDQSAGKGLDVRGNVTIERKGKKEDKELQDYYQDQMLRCGTQFYKSYELKGVLPPLLNIAAKDPANYGLQIADWLAWPLAEAVATKGSDLAIADPKYYGINEWALYKDKIWIGHPSSLPGNVGLKTVPDSSIGRSLLGVPLEKPTALAE